MYPRVVDIFAYQIHNTFFNPWTTYKPFTRVAFKHFLTNFYPLLWEKTHFIFVLFDGLVKSHAAYIC